MEDIPRARPAANARSPLRKPRLRGPVRAWEISELKKRFIEIYQLTGNVAGACAVIKRQEQTVQEWLDRDIPFAESCRAITTMWRSIREGQVRDLTGPALGVMGETMEQQDDKRLRFDAAKAVLRSEGLLKEKVEQEHTGEILLRVVPFDNA